MRVGLALLASVVASAPAAPVISYDPATNFNHYRNYTWVFPHPPANVDQTLYRQVHVAIDRSLSAHGFGHSSPGDFAVAFTIGPRSNMHASDFGHYAFYYSGEEAAAHRNWINNELAERADRDDTLSIDIYDTATKHSIWHGIAPVPVVPNTRQGIIDHEVDDVLRQFPPTKR
jgi:hypothetical protein